jgi:hypothetical protein
MNGNARELALSASLSCDKLQLRGLRDRNISPVMFAPTAVLMLKGAVNYVAEPRAGRGFQ